MLKKTSRRFKILLLVGLSILLCAIGILYLTPGSTPPITDAQGQPLAGSIASLEKMELGDVEQWILIRGEDTTNPIILFLHGGPGASEMVFEQKYMTELEKQFVVVMWDQRGAGKSHSAVTPNTAMNISQFVSDTHELTERLCNRFNQERIYLAGHSWGSIVGVLTVQKYPDLYYAYIGIGQVVNMQENERLSYEWILQQAEQAGNMEDVNKLKDIGMPPYTGDWMTKLTAQRKLLSKYGGEVYGSTEGMQGLVMESMEYADEYTFLDQFNYPRGLLDSMCLLWPEIMTVDLIQQAPTLEVPVYFMMGQHDYVTPYVLVEQYYEILTAPSKELISFENSAHIPNVEEVDKFNDVLTNRILPSTHAP